MFGRIATAGIVVALAVGGLATSASAAPKPTITATGDLACSGGGKVKAITYGSSPNFIVSVAAKLRMSCNGSTGNPAVTITKAKLSGMMSYTGDCTPDGQWGFSIVWKAKGGHVNSTRVGYSTSALTPSGWTAPGPGGMATVGGSYAGTNTSSISISGPAGTLQAACGQGPKKHVSSMSFTMFL